MKMRIILDNDRDNSKLFAEHKQSEGVTYCGVHGFAGYKFEGEGAALGRFIGSLGTGWFRVIWDDKPKRKRRNPYIVK